MKNNTTPFCKKCRTEAVESNAGLYTSKPFWYCRTCKEEVPEDYEPEEEPDDRAWNTVFY